MKLFSVGFFYSMSRSNDVTSAVQCYLKDTSVSFSTLTLSLIIELSGLFEGLHFQAINRLMFSYAGTRIPPGTYYRHGHYCCHCQVHLVQITPNHLIPIIRVAIILLCRRMFWNVSSWLGQFGLWYWTSSPATLSH